MTTLTASLEERIDTTTLQHVREEILDAHSGHGQLPESTAAAPEGRLARFFEDVVAKRFGHRHLAHLAAHRGRVATAWRDVPERMHMVANQTKLMLELVDDFRSGTYRQIPWRSLAISAAAILYAANPADVIPDFFPGLGMLDDVAVAALAARVIRKDLQSYCKFKGYPVEEYFAS
ncbi:MAG: hypothetical protein RL701_442 [Pseudomonadota bacterium]